MKIVNLALSALVLLLAIASAVLSFMLFGKRAEARKSWDKMIVAVANTAAALDQGSGTKVAANFAPGALNAGNVAELESKLAKLTDQAKQLITQRNALADALRKTGSCTEMRDLPKEEDFNNLNTYAAARDKVVGRVRSVVNSRNQMIGKVASVGGKIGASVNQSELRSGNLKSLDNFEKKISEIRNRENNFKSSLRTMASLANAGSVSFSGDGRQDLQKIINAFRKVKTELNETKNRANQAESKVASLQRTVESKNGVIASREKTIGIKDSQLKELKYALGLEENAEVPKRWADGSPEARRAVVGKVIDVNEKYGFVAIGLGKNSTVQQKYGKKKVNVNPNIANGMEMVAVRGKLSSKNAEFITRLKLKKVDADCSIAETVGTGKAIKVGDVVFFEDAK